ncbi:MAG: AAA family ATPase [Clostridia bacterium]|nr:AAA family ATPase [Clostridia bacterium]
MAKITSFSNQKGGVGKTTTCVNLSAYLAVMGKRVLLIDIDPQGNSTSGFGVNKTNLDKSTYSLISGDYADIKEVITSTSIKNLDIIPSNIDLAGAEIELANQKNREWVLARAIKPITDNYDYITIDCPPSLGLLTLNALVASNSVLIPIQSEYYALEGLSQLMNTIRLVMKLNPELKLEGVLLTMYDKRSVMSRQIAHEISKYFGNKMYKTKIPRNIRLSEAPSHGKPIHLHDSRSSGGLAYAALAREFISR